MVFIALGFIIVYLVVFLCALVYIYGSGENLTESVIRSFEIALLVVGCIIALMALTTGLAFIFNGIQELL